MRKKDGRRSSRSEAKNVGYKKGDLALRSVENFFRPVATPPNVHCHCCQQAHNIKVQQMLHFVLFDLWRFGSKCWTIYICYKHSVAATFIMAGIRVDVAYLSRFIVLFIIILINH